MEVERSMWLSVGSVGDPCEDENKHLVFVTYGSC